MRGEVKINMGVKLNMVYEGDVMYKQGNIHTGSVRGQFLLLFGSKNYIWVNQLQLMFSKSLHVIISTFHINCSVNVRPSFDTQKVMPYCTTHRMYQSILVCLKGGLALRKWKYHIVQFSDNGKIAWHVLRWIIERIYYTH